MNHASFSAKRRKRAHFATPEFDLTALSRLTGGCTVADFFDIDQGRGPYVMRSGSSGCKSNCEWRSIEQHAPTLTSSGLLMRNERTGREWRVPTDDMAKLRSLAALPTSHTKDATARRCAVARAVDGKVSREIAKTAQCDALNCSCGGSCFFLRGSSLVFFFLVMVWVVSRGGEIGRPRTRGGQGAVFRAN